MPIPKLMLITSGELCENLEAFQKVLDACHQGLPWIQIREKQSEAKDLLKLTRSLREVTQTHGVFLSVNERTDIALVCEADGVHFSENGISPQVIKKINPKLMCGVSVHSHERAIRSENEGADYVIFGPIFDPISKKNSTSQGLENLRMVVKSVSIPVIVVGGMTPEKARMCMDDGAYGVAAIGAFFQSCDLKDTLTQFLGVINKYES